MRFSSGLTALLILALELNKPAEADELMIRITARIHANQQAIYLALARSAWQKYFQSGWLRQRLGVGDDRLIMYADFVLETTKKRLENGVVRPAEIYKDQSMKEMLEELDRNTVGAEGYNEDFINRNVGENEGDDEDESSSKTPKLIAPGSILRKPATPDQIGEIESKIGRPLPDDLKEFYTITDGTAPIRRGPWANIFLNRLPAMQELFWEDDVYMADYSFELLPGAKLPVSIDWPGIEGGGIAMYEHEGQHTDYVWIIEGELVVKAKELLEEAYRKAGEAEKKILDAMMSDYYGGWEELKAMKSCWYQQSWGDPDSMILCPSFRAFLSLVVLESSDEEERSPVKMPKEEY